MGEQLPGAVITVTDADAVALHPPFVIVTT
jgi:hypothetical protein